MTKKSFIKCTQTGYPSYPRRYNFYNGVQALPFGGFDDVQNKNNFGAKNVGGDLIRSTILASWFITFSAYHLAPML
jgi:hypothetical protein